MFFAIDLHLNLMMADTLFLLMISYNAISNGRSNRNLLSMIAHSYGNITWIPRIMTVVVGLISDVENDDPLENVCSDPSYSSIQRERIIIVANQLPMEAQRKQDSSNNRSNWFFS